MALRRMETRHALRPQPRPEPAHDIRQNLRRPPRRATPLAGGHRQEFGLHRRKPQHVDAEPGIDLVDFQREQRTDPLGRAGGMGEADLHGRHLSVRPEGLQPHPPGAAPLLLQPVAERSQQPVEPGLDILAQADRIGQGQPDREMQRRPRRRDRFRLEPEGLIDPSGHLLAEAAGEGGARQVEEIAHPAQAEPRQRLDGALRQPQGRDRQRLQRGPQRARGRDQAERAPARRGEGPPPGRAGAGGMSLLLNGIAVQVAL